MRRAWPPLHAGGSLDGASAEVLDSRLGTLEEANALFFHFQREVRACVHAGVKRINSAASYKHTTTHYIRIRTGTHARKHAPAHRHANKHANQRKKHSTTPPPLQLEAELSLLAQQADSARSTSSAVQAQLGAYSTGPPSSSYRDVATAMEGPVIPEQRRLGGHAGSSTGSAAAGAGAAAQPAHGGPRGPLAGWVGTGQETQQAADEEEWTPSASAQVRPGGGGGEGPGERGASGSHRLLRPMA